MKSQQLLQVVYSFFLGLVLVGFVAIGMNTFHPQPDYYEGVEPLWESWALSSSIILLTLATLIMLISLLIPVDRAVVVSNGLLLGGVFTMIYAVGMTVTADPSGKAFAVVTAALAVTIVMGWLKFARRSRAGADAQPAISDEELGTLEQRVQALEARLGAAARVLKEPN